MGRLIICILSVFMIGCSGMTLTNNSKQNIEIIKAEARKIYRDYPIVADLAVAQAILESRLDGKPSTLALKGNNLFGIKDTSETKSMDGMSTVECSKGSCSKTKANFAKFDNIQDSFLYHRKLMLNGTKSNPSRYIGVFTAKTFEEAAQAVAKGGYATDSFYTKKLINIYNKYVK